MKIIRNNEQILCCFFREKNKTIKLIKLLYQKKKAGKKAKGVLVGVSLQAEKLCLDL